MSLALAVSHVLDLFGAVYTLRRATPAAGANAWTLGAPGAATYYPCTGRETSYGPDELRAGVKEHEALIIVDAASLSVVPREGDRIALGTYTADPGAAWREVTDVEAPRRNGEAIIYRITVRV